jgi:hypothetical protein
MTTTVYSLTGADRSSVTRPEIVAPRDEMTMRAPGYQPLWSANIRSGLRIHNWRATLRSRLIVCIDQRCADATVGKQRAAHVDADASTDLAASASDVGAVVGEEAPPGDREGELGA